jgi:hypothetical protein
MEIYVSLVLLCVLVVGLYFLKNAIISILMMALLVVGVYHIVPDTQPYLEPVYSIIVKGFDVGKDTVKETIGENV